MVNKQKKCVDEDSVDNANLKKKTKRDPDKPRMPRFMLFLMILFVLNFVLTAASLVITSRDNITYTPERLLDFLNVVLEIVIFWFVMRRYKIVRPFTLGLVVFNVVVIWGYHFAFNGFGSFDNAATDTFPNIILGLYFGLSKKACAYLSKPFTTERDPNPFEAGKLKIDRRRWPFYRNLIIYFCVFSLLGHWFEAGCSKLMEIGIIKGEVDYSNTMMWRDWFYPYPMHGFAVVMIALLLYPFWQWLLKKCKTRALAYAISFFTNMMVCVCIEFFMGLAVNSNLQLWNYTNMPFNFMGQVCLQNALGFGAAASAIAWFAYPALERLIARVPRNVMNVVFVFVVAAYMIPQTLYLVDPPELPDADFEYSVYAGDSADNVSLSANVNTSKNESTGSNESGFHFNLNLNE